MEYTAWVTISCTHCNKPSVAEISFKHDLVYSYKELTELLSDTCYKVINADVIRLLPDPPKPYSHIAIPEKIGTAFNMLQRDLINPLNQSPPLIIAGCRMVLDVVIKDKGGVGKNLKEQIDSLAMAGIVAGVLKDWAHQLRSEGNKAVHELEGSKEEADDLVKFVRFLLQYLYELPYEVDSSRYGEEYAKNKWGIKSE
jgi:hypothetical protein